MHRPPRSAWVALLTAPFLFGCQSAPDGPSGPEGRLRVDVAALTLPGLTNACWSLTVESGTGDTVWSRADLCADDYGDGAASLSYVGTCDASFGAAANVVTLELQSLHMGDPPALLPSGDYANPCPVGEDRCQQTVDCVEDADVPVTFDVAVVRRATQGFFDVAVSFNDIFCSAKFDCERNGQPLELLHNPATGARDTTVVLAFACTSGPGQNTVLNMSDLVLTCQDTGNTSVAIDPAAGPGNHYSDSFPSPTPLVFQAASYMGEELFNGVTPPVNKRYWNVAIGVNLPDADYPSCTIQATATATEVPLLDAFGHLPAVVTWPYVGFDIPLTDGDGEIDCGSYAVNQAPEVATSYSSISGDQVFCYYMRVDDGDLEAGGQCLTDITCTVPGTGGDVELAQQGQTVTITAPTAAPAQFTLPYGDVVVDCCQGGTP